LFRDKIDRPFEKGLASAMQVNHIAQRHLLVEPDHVGIVTKVSEYDMQGRSPSNGGVWMSGGSGAFYPGPTVICTGYRAAELVPGLKVDVKVGHAIHFKGRLGEGELQHVKSTLSLASPYVHQKLYQLDEDTIYFADSVAVSREQYEKRRGELL